MHITADGVTFGGFQRETSSVVRFFVNFSLETEASAPFPLMYIWLCEVRAVRVKLFLFSVPTSLQSK